jgi:hypothetical protein
VIDLYILAYSIWHLYAKSEKNGILEHHIAADVESAIYIVAEPGSCYGIAPVCAGILWVKAAMLGDTIKGTLTLVQ